MNIGNLLKSGTIYLIGSIFERALPVIFLPIYTKYLTTLDYGVLSVLSIMIMWPEKVVAAPVGNGITRFFYSPTYSSSKPSLIFSGYVFTFIQSLLLGIVLFTLSSPISKLLFGDIHYGLYVKIFSLVMVFKPLSTLMASLARIQNQAKLYVLINVIVHSSAAIIQLVLLKVFSLGIMSMVIGIVYISVLTFILYIPNTIKSIDYRFSIDSLKAVLAFGYPLVIGALVALGSQTIDRVWVLKYFDLATVGLLAIAYKVPLIIDFMITVPLKQALLPFIYEMEKNKIKQITFVRNITNHLVAFVCGATLFLSLSAEELIALMTSDESYKSASIVVPLLLVSSASQALALVFGYGLAMAKRTFLISMTSVYVLLTYTLLIVLFVPSFGLIGVGIASCISYIFRNIIRAHFSGKYYGQNFESRKIVILSLLGITFYTFGNLLDIDVLILSLLCNLLVSVCYLVLVYSGLVFSMRDLYFVFRNIAIKSKD